MTLIKDVIIGISKKLGNFKCKIYVDEVKSNITTPCFILSTVGQVHTRYSNDRYYKKIPVQVVYLPKTQENNSFEIYQVLSELNYLLEFIQLQSGDLIRGREMNYHIENNTLYFYVSYGTFVRKIEDEYKMNKLELEKRSDV